ncbi:glutaminyl-peptide cyclotransferase [Mucilaginibacter aquatilis]|uniref:Glutaminyl-peptide cyclotransferase n=1 Tax=Mucilaginibacter aquatilis TaxID=1517760 RepID=A0A6I4IG26_9SPHI|nr:glutaminyl-peptide cyclotransferase [Mucilaginibacter aquatilis]MVN92588.1 glutaminyl-peptide cyclotransferase [Mucilaginibacter aquatilis]
MKNKYILGIATIILAIYSCGEKNKSVDISISPDAGANYKQGEKVDVKVGLPADYKVDSIVYLIDSVRLAAKTDTTAYSLATTSLGLGVKLLTARIYADGKMQEQSTNINLLAAKAPELYTYQIEKTFAHDTASFTEGFEYHDGVFYESDGGTCDQGERSSLRKTDINGKVLQKIEMDCNAFNEGITVIDNKVVQLTYHERAGYVYDKSTLKLLSKFSFVQGQEGWGMCNDGKNLYCNTGSNQIFVMDKENFRTLRTIDVYDDQGPIDDLNEMEYIDGMIYANVWQKDDIVVIDPKTGAVVKRIDLSSLTQQATAGINNSDAVLNGIAWDAAGKRLFVTGKKWPHTYQIKMVKKQGV